MRSVCNTENPVAFPPGRARLATCPIPTGSAWVAKTMGMFRVACRAASTSVEEVAKITSTFRRTSSAASSRICAAPSAQRNSMTTFLPTTYPSSRNPVRSASTRSAEAVAGAGPRNPMSQTLDACCACACAGHAAALASPVMNCPSLHSITMSASCWRCTGTVNPSIRAVFMLRTNSNCVGRSIGRSEGSAPVNTFIASLAARRDMSFTLGP